MQINIVFALLQLLENGCFLWLSFNFTSAIPTVIRHEKQFYEKYMSPFRHIDNEWLRLKGAERRWWF